MKKAVILINPFLCTEAEQYQPRRIAEELSALGVQADILPNRFFARIEGGRIAEELSARYDFCVYLDKDKYVPRMLEKRGMRLFNRAEAVELCDDKMLTHIALSDRGIPMPKTIPAPLCYKEGAAAEICEALGYPVVVKECYGSLGQQVYLARDRGELIALSERLKLRPYLLQEYIPESAGRDLRVICIGGEAVACMVRRSRSDFRSNLSCGGRGEPFPLDGKIRTLAKEISDTLGLDYCGIDFLFQGDAYLLCEVNSNAFFGGIEGVTGVNIARKYAEYMVKNAD